MSKSKRRPTRFSRRIRFESLEERVVLDSQIGTVTMPVAANLSVSIYDANGQHVRTLLNLVAEPQGNVALNWDGRDDLGRLVYQNDTYSWKAVISNTNAVNEGGSGDSQFGPLPDGVYGDNYFQDAYLEANDTVDGIAVNSIGGIRSEVGGTFARNDGESSFGDTGLTDLNGAASGKMDLSNSISASGSLYYSSADAHTANGSIFIGHYSSSTADNRREFLGIEIKDAGNDLLEARARMYRPDGNFGNGAMSDWIVLPIGQVNFSYSYDPNATTYGQVTLNIHNSDHSFDQTVVGVLEQGHRTSGAFFDAFGMGIPTGSVSTDNPANTAKVFMDDVAYTGHTGTVSFATNPGWTGTGNATDGNSYGWSTYNTADGSVYEASQGEEGAALRKLNADGSLAWIAPYAGNISVAANANYLFVSQRINGVDRVIRLLARDGSYMPFSQAASGIVTVNSDSFDPRPPGQSKYTPDQYRQQFSAWGIAADTQHVFVSNYRKNEVEVYDANTGLLLDKLTSADDAGFVSPVGIGVQADNTIWVAHNGGKVTQYTWNSGTGIFTKGNEITGLNDPSGVSVGGPSGHLYITERGTGKVLEYSIVSTPTLAGLGNSFGSLQTSQAVTDTTFAWGAPWMRWAGLAVDQNGIINVNDDRRIQRFYGTTGGGHTAGDLYQSWWGEFGPAPTDTYNYNANGKFTLLDGNYEYEIDPEYTGGPRAGWLGDGSWRLVSRFILDEGAGVRRTLNDNGTLRDYRFAFNGQSTVTAYLLGNGSDRMAAIVGLDNWTGTDRMQSPQRGEFNWTDTDGDGQIDWGGGGTGTSGEVTWTIPLGQQAQPNGYVLHAGWVDYNGNVWAIVDKSIVKVPLEGFDAQHNPIYNWTHAVTVVPFQDDDWDFQPRFVRVAANGDVCALGATKFPGDLNPTGSSAIHGGQWVARYDSSGNRKLLMPIVDSDLGDNDPPAIALDENDPNSNYFYVGVGEGSYFYVRQYTKDGLLVSRLSSEGSGIETGWIDHQEGVNAVTQPLTGKTYVFGEDIVYGRSVRFRLDNLNSVSQQQGNFNWTVAHIPTSNWQFQDNLTDSVGGHDGVFSGGSPSYAVGGVTGKAIDLDGVNDYIDLPITEDPAAYTISLWVKPSDTTNVNIINRADATVGSSYYQLRLNSAGKFEHSIVDGNVIRTVTGNSVVSPDTWAHVVIVAQNNGLMRLYVNGSEDAVAQPAGTLTAAGDRFRLGGSVGSYGYFDGLIDDLRIYQVPLSSIEIQAIYSLSTAVKVTATDPHAAESGPDPGVFTITRTDTNGNLVVNYTISGTATSGSDYTALPGSVTILNGQTSANVTVTPIDDAVLTNDASETVILSLTSTANYVVSTPSIATVVISDNENTGDPGWTGVGNTNSGNGNNFGWSYNTNNAGGTLGEIGGTIARNANETYYADTNLTQIFDLDDLITASGKLTIFGQSNTDGEWILGHISSSVDTDDSILGIEFIDGSDTSVRFKARVGRPDSTTGATESGEINLPNGVYNFTYTYNPSLGSSGRLTVRIFNGSYDQTATADLNSNTRLGGSTFDAFGMGTKNRPGSGSDPNKTVKMYIDDLTYSGFQPVLSTVSVNTTDPTAAEQGLDTGTYTFTRTGSTAGNLVVNYMLSGTATSGADYTALPGSVTILGGQTTATVTLTPIDDAVVDGSETAILTLSANAAYTFGLSTSATITIADNDAIPPLVTVLASDAYAAEQGTSTGAYTFTRNGSTAGNLVVNYTLSGTATSGADYTALPGSVTILAGQTSASVTLTPVDDAVSEASESAILTVTPSLNYSVGVLSSAAITIFDNDVAPTIVSVIVPDSSAAELGSNTGLFTFKRNGTSGNLVVNYTVSGTATSGADYTALPGSITILAGQTSASVTVTPVQDSIYEGSETVLLSITPSANYLIGVNGNGTVDIADDETITTTFASDNFESGNGNGGTGFGNFWSLTGAAAMTSSGVPKTGSYHLMLTSNDGVASRPVNLSGVTTAYLIFDWKATSFESGETAVVEIFNGTSWVNVMTVTAAQADNVYHHAVVNLSSQTLGSSFQVRFRSLMSDSADSFFVDNLSIGQ